METLCGIIRRFTWINFKHPGGLATTRCATSGKFRHAKSDAICAIPDASCAPKMGRPLWLRAARATPHFRFSLLGSRPQSPFGYSRFWGKEFARSCANLGVHSLQAHGGPCSGISWRLWIALGPRDKIAGAAFKNQLPLRLQLERPVFSRQGRLARIRRRRHLNTYDSAILAREERSLGGS